MLPFVADENLNNDIVRGLLRQCPSLDIVRVQDRELSGTDDATVLEWAAQHHRVLLTHDVSTMTQHAYERVQLGKSMPGVFEINRATPISLVIEECLLLAEGSLKDEWEGQVLYLPLR